MAFDFETKGLDPSLPGTSLRSISMANDGGCFAIDLEGLAPDCRAFLFSWLLQQDLVAYNYVFDGLWLAAETGVIKPAHFDCFGAFRQLATEAWAGQRWGLKIAMTDILGWDEPNTADLDDWLRANKMGKDKMSWAPWDIIGPYNALDSGSTWQLYQYFRTFKDKFPAWWDYHTVDYLNLSSLLIEQQLDGLTIDRKQLADYGSELDNSMQDKLIEFLQLPDVAPHIAAFNQSVVDDIVAAEPPKFKMNGEIKVRWQKWQAKLAAARETNHFNTDSNDHLKWLFYQRMKLSVPLKTEKGQPSVNAKALSQLGIYGRLLLEYRHNRDVKKFVTAIGNVQYLGKLHPQIKNPATVSGRCGGGVDDQ